MKINKLILLVIYFITGCSSHSKDAYYIPKGFDGWLCAVYNTDGLPLELNENGQRKNVFNSSGIMKTSSKPIRGVVSPKDFFYFEGDQDSMINIERIPEEYLGGVATYNRHKIEDSVRVIRIWVGDKSKWFKGPMNYENPNPACGTMNNHFVFDLDAENRKNNKKEN